MYRLGGTLPISGAEISGDAISGAEISGDAISGAEISGGPERRSTCGRSPTRRGERRSRVRERPRLGPCGEGEGLGESESGRARLPGVRAKVRLGGR